MNVQIDMTETEDLPETYTEWRPPGWIVGDDDEPYIPEKIEELYAMYDAAGYYTRGGSLSDKAIGKPDEDEARDVAHNRKLLRDAWNTHGAAWRLGAALIGRAFRVDPFWNQGASDLPELAVMLDGLTPLTDGMLSVRDARNALANGAYDDATRRVVEQRLAELGDVPDDFPLNWRQQLVAGEAAAAANGPHSCTAKWLRCTAAYGSQEFAAGFVPDNGDGWFQSIAMTATLVVRLGRVPCRPPPGITSSSPRGASALCVWIPPHVRAAAEALHERLQLRTITKARRAELAAELDALLPEPTRRVLLTGRSIAVPLWSRPRAGTQLAIVQRGDLIDGDGAIVDLGIAG